MMNLSYQMNLIEYILEKQETLSNNLPIQAYVKKKTTKKQK